MKSRHWIWVFALLAVLLIALSVFLLRQEDAAAAEVWLDDELIATLPLTENAELRVESPQGGYNHIVVNDGTLAVVEADCPDGVCVKRGKVRGGAPVVCLPHRLVISFTGAAEIDGTAG